MKRTLILAVLACSLSSCKVTDVYLEADDLTYKAIAPAYSRYVEADAALSPDQKARRMRTLSSWRARIDAAKGGK